MRDRARCVRRCRAGCVRTARRTGAALGLGHLCTPPWRARRATKARRGRVAAPSGLAPACALHQAQRQPFFCVRGPSRSAPLRRCLPLARGGMVLEARIWGCRAPPWPRPDGPGALVLPAFGVLWAPPLRRARAPHPPRPCAKTHAVSRHRNAHARPHLGRGPSQEARRALGRGVRRARRNWLTRWRTVRRRRAPDTAAAGVCGVCWMLPPGPPVRRARRSCSSSQRCADHPATPQSLGPSARREGVFRAGG